MRGQKKRIRALAGLGVLLLTLQGTFPAMADTWDMQRRGSITLTTSYAKGSGDSQTWVPVPGVELSLYRVAAAQTKDGQVVYVPSQGLEEFEESINSGLSKEDNTDIAGRIGDHAALDKLIYGTAQKTSAEGKAIFADVETGMYLVKQTAEKSGYYTMKSFLIPVPMMEEDGGGWNYTIEARPKMERHTGGDNPGGGGHSGGGGGGGGTPPATIPETVPETIPQPDTPAETLKRLPQTGMRRLPVMICAVGGLILISGGWVMRRRDRQQEKDGELR